MRPANLEARAAAALSLSTAKLASTWTLAAATSREMVEEGTPARLARPVVKPS
jgi:hypothetical protein